MGIIFKKWTKRWVFILETRMQLLLPTNIAYVFLKNKSHYECELSV